MSAGGAAGRMEKKKVEQVFGTAEEEGLFCPLFLCGFLGNTVGRKDLDLRQNAAEHHHWFKARILDRRKPSEMRASQRRLEHLMAQISERPYNANKFQSGSHPAFRILQIHLLSASVAADGVPRYSSKGEWTGIFR